MEHELKITREQSSAQRRARLAAAVVAVLFIAGLRHADGGADSSYGALVVLPLLWLALYATLREVATAGAITAAAFVVPVALGLPGHPAPEWREAGVWGVAMPVAALAAQRIVARARARARTLESLTARLKTTEESFRAAFSDAPVGQFMCAPTGVLLRVNDALCALAGRTPDDLLGAEVAELIDAEDGPRVDIALQAAWAADDQGDADPMSELEVRLAAPSGDRYALVRIGLVRSPERRPLYLLGHLVDVTERRAEALERDVHARATAAVHAATSGISGSVASRQLVCDAALDLARGCGGLLMEADRRGNLTATAASGAGVLDTSVHIGREPSQAAAALATHRTVFVADTAAEAAGAPAPAGLGDARSILYEPILRDGAGIGVFVVAWPTPVDGVGDERVVAARVLAAQAANLLARADLYDDATRLAHVDPLTGLPNRRAWEHQLPTEIARALRDGKPLAAGIIDLDHFKAHNDEFGHQAGDRVLVEAASSWRQRLRETDLLARYGGEEFAVLLPACDADRALELLDRLRLATPDPCTCSIGVAIWDRRESADALVARADRALYAAKESGRDRTHLSLPRRAAAGSPTADRTAEQVH